MAKTTTFTIRFTNSNIKTSFLFVNYIYMPNDSKTSTAESRLQSFYILLRYIYFRYHTLDKFICSHTPLEN